MAQSVTIAEIEQKWIDRFWSRVDKSSICWLVSGGGANGNGKGMGHVVVYCGKGVPRIYAHRLSFLLFNGSLNSDLNVLHSCDNPRCVNPEHLRQGTQADNARDASIRGRTANGNTHLTHCKNGHNLSPENVWNVNGHRQCKPCHRKPFRKPWRRA